MKTGARLLVEGLQREGVETIFGYPGGAVLPVYDELYDAPLRHVLVRHEQAAAHAADGYARASGKTGVCLATSGPGACNLVTGIATAYMDSVPLVAVTGQVPTTMLGNDAFQESDITGITFPITKHNYLVKDAAEIGQVVRDAFYIAGTGRQGPVLIDLPKDVMTAQVDPVPEVQEARLRGYQPTYEGHPRQVERAVALIREAERPLLYIGGGVVASGAAAEVLALAELTAIPVASTLMGLGAVPCDHPLSLGMIGMHGTEAANFAVTECDLLIAVGVRFDDRVTGRVEAFAPQAAVIHIDIDPAEIGKNKPVDVPIVGDARLVLAAITAKLARQERGNGWLTRVRRWQKEEAGPAAAAPGPTPTPAGGLDPAGVIRQMNALLDDEAIIVSEVGQNQMWAAQHYCFRRPRTWLTSGGLGTMGYGFPASIGAQFACPDRTVALVAGDGSFQMNIQELGTVVEYDVPVKVVILNNLYLGMVRQWQELFYDRRYSYTELRPVDFVGIAKAYGVEGMRVDGPDEVGPGLEECFGTEGPFVLDVRIEREANVFPMVPAGAAINEMIGRRGG